MIIVNKIQKKDLGDDYLHIKLHKFISSLLIVYSVIILKQNWF